MKDYCSTVNYIETDHLIVNRDCQDLLRDAGLQSFESVWRFSGGEVVKQIKERSVIRFDFSHHGMKRTFYLKRHHLKFIGLGRLLSRFFPELCVSQGRLEFDNICDFRKNKLPTVAPVAAGERSVRLFWSESFLITEDPSPLISLENMLRDYPQYLQGPKHSSRRKILLHEMALLARKMHERGFNHLDFNTTHILLHYENHTDVPTLALFDLQRVDKRKFCRFRWKIKSLARLNYSLPDGLFNEKDRVYLFLCYQGKENFNFVDSLQWSWIKKKTDRIRRHTQKIMAKKTCGYGR